MPHSHNDGNILCDDYIVISIPCLVNQSARQGAIAITVDRKGEHPANHLAGYQGWMHADGYSGFNELYRSGGVREVACLTHVRRKFVDVFQAEGSLIAEEALKLIAGLYAVEKEGRGRPPDERLRFRQAGAKPILDDLESWLQAQLPRISGKSKLAKAIRYALYNSGCRIPKLWR